MRLKKLALIVICCLLPAAVSAQLYRSAFGFTTDLSENWLFVSRERLVQNPDFFDIESAEMLAMDPAMISRVRNMVASRQVEFLYYLHNDPGFVNNINVYVSNPLRSDLDQIEGPLCSNLQSQLRQSYQRSENVRVYGCERKKLYNIDSISSAFDGVLAGSRSYSFLFNSNSGTINLTITCKLARCREVFSDSATLFKNMRF